METKDPHFLSSLFTFPYYLLLFIYFFLRQDVSQLTCCSLIRWYCLVSKSQGTSCLFWSIVRITGTYHSVCLSLYMGTDGLNAGPHAFVTNTLPTEPSPQSPQLHLLGETVNLFQPISTLPTQNKEDHRLCESMGLCMLDFGLSSFKCICTMHLTFSTDHSRQPSASEILATGLRIFSLMRLVSYVK